MKKLVILFCLVIFLSGCEGTEFAKYYCKDVSLCEELEPTIDCTGNWVCENNYCEFVCEGAAETNERIICEEDSDCVPAECCHPTSVVNKKYAPNCAAVSCTMSCEGPLDCGAGHAECQKGTCVIVPNEEF